MNYPLISEYIEAIKAAEDNFEQLNYLRPVLDEAGEPVMSSGNFAVVFKMKDKQTGRLYAVKCFLKEQEGRAEAYRMIAEELEYVNSTFLTPIKYLDKELFVDTKTSDETEFPVLLMDWVKGQTLDKYIHNHLYDQYDLSLLAYQFSRLAMWLMPLPFAHGDLKPDNILVKEDGTLVLVDYDGMFVPAMKGQKARELGSPDFRHPSRTEDDFDEHIDDFSLSSILLSLKAISLQPSLLKEYGASDRLLFSENDYRNLSESKVLDALKPLIQNTELASLYSLLILALAQKNLSQVSFRLFKIKEYEGVELSTKATKEDFANAWTDEYGVKYSKDRKKLLKAPMRIREYVIRKGTIIICDNAFNDTPGGGNHDIHSVFIPNTVTHIGNGAFRFCYLLKKVNIPNSVKHIGHDAFTHCFNINVTIPNSVIFIGNEAFSNCRSLSLSIIPESVSYIGNYAFYKCYSLKQITILGAIKTIKSQTFAFCGMRKVVLPNSISHIENRAFWECYSLEEINFPDSLQVIGDCVFDNCQSLLRAYLPNSLIQLGYGVFRDCESLLEVKIPETIMKIDMYVFRGTYTLSEIYIPASVIKIDEEAFQCSGITSIFFNSVVDIDNTAFDACSLETIFIPQGTTAQFEKMLPDFKDNIIEMDDF